MILAVSHLSVRLSDSHALTPPQQGQLNVKASSCCPPGRCVRVPELPVKQQGLPSPGLDSNRIQECLSTEPGAVAQGGTASGACPSLSPRVSCLLRPTRLLLQGRPWSGGQQAPRGAPRTPGESIIRSEDPQDPPALPPRPLTPSCCYPGLVLGLSPTLMVISQGHLENCKPRVPQRWNVALQVPLLCLVPVGSGPRVDP